jgi:hypothetical protein
MDNFGLFVWKLIGLESIKNLSEPLFCAKITMLNLQKNELSNKAYIIVIGLISFIFLKWAGK